MPHSAALDHAIMSAIAASEDGLTDYQIEVITGRKHQSVSANRRHLVERGLVAASDRRRALPNGRMAIVWVLCDIP